jgi:hypothetical protein
MFSFTSLVLISLAATASPAGPVATAGDGTRAAAQSAPLKIHGIVWDARAVEHLWNRAGFGARPGEIEQGIAMGPDALVDRFLTQRADVEPPFIESVLEPLPRKLKEMSEEDQKKIKRDYNEKDRRQLIEYMSWWIDRMAKGDDPLLDRTTLFWHGLLTSSIEQVKRSYPMLKQNEFLRANALGSYSDLLYGIAKDPAMLIFLNNNSNRKGNPNENLARELMELFSLGVGNYTEEDIKQAARALTGRSTTREDEYEYRKGAHDDGDKTVLGVTGKLDGDDLVKILLQQDACPRYVARKMITYFEGVEPDKARLEEYATFLRKNDFKIQPFLRKLFLDPAFYRDEIVGARVQSPIDFMVGTARRLGVQVPPIMLGSGAALLGQRIFAPPSVKGWDEGMTWITTSSLMQRGNLAGFMLGLVKLDDVLNQSDLATEPDPMPMQPGKMTGGDDGHPMTGGDGDKPMTGEDGAKRATGGDTKPAGGELESRQKRAERSKIAKGGKATGFAYDALRRIEASGWMPAVNFTARMEKLGCKTDQQIVDRMLEDLLAIKAPQDTRAKMLGFLTGERVQLSVRDGHLSEAGADGERLLRRLAHLILSLPEAQLM